MPPTFHNLFQCATHTYEEVELFRRRVLADGGSRDMPL